MGTLIGGIVGAVVGVAIHVALATGMFGEPIEASWFAIITGLLTGLGVRQATKAGAGVSYARGAVAALIALAAIVLTFPAIQKTMTTMAKAPAPRPAQDADDATETDDATDADKDAAAAEDEPAEKAATATAPAVAVGGENKLPAMPNEFNTWQFLYMALGALLAYQFGRGSEARAYQPPAGEAPVAMDPSN